MKIGLHGCSAFLFASLLAGPALAQDPAPTDSDWAFSFTPYVWGAGIEGSVSAGDFETDVDAGFTDILKNLNLGFMGIFEAQRGRFLVIFDGSYMNLESDAEAGPVQRSVGPLSIQQGPVLINIPRVSTTIGPLDVKAELDQTLGDLKLGFRVLDQPLMAKPEESDHRRFTIDLLAGVRYWRLRSQIDVSMPPIRIPGFTIDPSIPAFPHLDLPGIAVGGVTFGGIDRTVDETVDWFDPIVGARVRVDLTDKLMLGAQADIGGFGSGSGDGSASELTSMAQAGFAYKLGETWRLSLGYRVLEVQRNHADLLMHGPILGLGKRF